MVIIIMVVFTCVRDTEQDQEIDRSFVWGGGHMGLHCLPLFLPFNAGLLYEVLDSILIRHARQTPPQSILGVGDSRC